jgi:DNA-binding GntR family transcriptional regulator
MAILGIKPETAKQSAAEPKDLLPAVLSRDAAMAKTITRNHRLPAGQELAEAICELCISKVETGDEKEPRRASIH